MKKAVVYVLAAVLAISMLSVAIGSKSHADEGKTKYVISHQITVHKEDNNASEAVKLPYRTEVYDTGRTNKYGSWRELIYNGNTVWWWPEDGEISDSLPVTNFSGSTEYQSAALSVAQEIYTQWKTGYGHNASDGTVAADGKRYFDCSGFVSYVLDKAMSRFLPVYNVSANIADLYETTSIYNRGFAGEFIAETVCEGTLDMATLRPGDVLFFDLKGYPGHCGLYLGNGEMLHSTENFDGSVRLMPVKGFYEEHFISAKRYLPDVVAPARKKAYAAASTTTIYKNSGENATKLTSIRLMQPMKVLYTDNGNWAYVELANGKKGFTLLENVCTNLAGKGIDCTVRNDGLKLLKKKFQSAKSITLKRGKKVSLRGRSGNYYKVKYNGKFYYIYTPKSIADKLTTY